MTSTPDLSGIINLIMQNPALIDQISALAKQSQNTEPEQEPSADTVSEQTAVITDTPVISSAKSNRRDLINAMKPYLSENRQIAIDSMSSILDVIDVVMKK